LADFWQSARETAGRLCSTLKVTTEQKPIRWWPAWVVLLAAAGGLSYVWLDPEPPRQARNLRTAMIVICGGALLLLWWVLFSRARWRSRAVALGLALACGAAAALTLEIRGVTGDLIPIVEFKWKARHTVAESKVQAPETNGWRKVEGQFPGFYGPERNARIPGVMLETNWTEHPPQILWRQPAGPAWSGFAVQDGLAITQEQRESAEQVVCYEVVSGRTVWSHTDEAQFNTVIAGEGPRATPTIASNRVYTYGATGILNCFELGTGRRIWTRDTLRDNDAKLPEWGLASSPLVTDGWVVVSVGGKNGRSLVAYRAEDGEFAWGAGQAGADYSSPVEATLLGERQIVIFNGFGLVSHSLDGKILWDYAWPGGHPHITPPQIVGTNMVLASSGYGTGAELIEIARSPGGWRASRVWKSIGMKSKFGPLFVAGGHVYGLDDGMLACVELKTGHRRWKDGRYGHGQGLLAGGLILLTSEKGDVVLIQPDPERLIEVAKFRVFSDKTWNPPALAGEYLLARNHKEAACLKLKLASPAL
jgi:outer membrane protein assembly factor BamB